MKKLYLVHYFYDEFPGGYEMKFERQKNIFDASNPSGLRLKIEFSDRTYRKVSLASSRRLIKITNDIIMTNEENKPCKWHVRVYYNGFSIIH